MFNGLIVLKKGAKEFLDQKQPKFNEFLPDSNRIRHRVSWLCGSCVILLNNKQTDEKLLGGGNPRLHQEALPLFLSEKTCSMFVK